MKDQDKILTIFLSTSLAVRLLDIKVPVVWRRRCRWIAHPRTDKEEGIGCHVVLVTWDSLLFLVGNLEPSSNFRKNELSPVFFKSLDPRNSHRSGSMLQWGKLDRQGLVEWQVPDLVWKSLTPGGLKSVACRLVVDFCLLTWRLHPKSSKSDRDIVRDCWFLVQLCLQCTQK